MNSPKTAVTPRTIILMLFFIVIIPFLLLLISRHWDWWEAWVYALISILGFVISRLLATRRHPDLLVERSRFLQHENAKSWDRLLAPLVGLGSGFILVVAGLDELYGWSPAFSLPVKILSLVFILVGYAISSYALIENRFFSGMARIQTERGHRVVSMGPYAWICHPGYSGALLLYLFTPLFLDLSWAFIPVILLTVSL